MQTYTQSETGTQLTADQIKSGSFVPNTFFIESGTGARKSASDFASNTPTVFSSTTKQDAIPDIKQTTANYANSGVQTDPKTGVAMLSNGQAYTPPDTTDTTKANDLTAGYYGDTYYAPGSTIPKDITLSKYSPSQQAAIDSMNELLKQSDATTATTVQNIQNQYASLVSTQQRVNQAQEKSVSNALKMGGSTGKGSAAQFAPISSSGIVQSQVNYGVQQIADLQAKENAAIAEAQAAGLNQKYQIQSNINSQIEKIRTEKIAAAKDLSDKIAEQNKALQEKMIASSRDNAIADLVSQGVTDPKQLIDYLNFYDNGKPTRGDFTAEEIAKTLKNLTPENSDIPNDAKTLEYLKKTGQVSKNTTLFDMYKMKADAERKPEAASATQNMPLQAFTFLGYIPTQLKNSDAEKKLWLDYYNQASATGMNLYQIVDQALGYKVDNPTPFSEGLRQYAASQNLSQNEIASLGRLINSNKPEQAIQVVESKAYDTLKKNIGTDFVPESDVTYAVKQVNDITKLLDAASLPPSILTGSISKFLGAKFGVTNTAEMYAKLTNFTTDIINKRAGSAITESEWKRLVADSVPSKTDTAGVWITKLNALQSNLLDKVNAQRAQAQLPKLNIDQLLDRKKRVDLYADNSVTSIPEDPTDIQLDGGIKVKHPF